MSNKEILEVYRRYVVSLSEENADLATNYQAMDRFISEHCEDKELKGLLYMDILYVALCFVRLNEVRLKDLAHGNWDSHAVKECYSRVKNLKEAFNEYDSARFIYLFSKFCNWVNGFESSPCLQLYFWQVYSDTNMQMFINNHNKLEKVIVRTEIEEAQQPEGNEDQSDQTDAQ